MCHYVTATMSAVGDEAAVRRIAKGYLLRWEPIENPSVRRILESGEKYFFTTHGMCDCGTDLGSALRIDNSLRPPDHEREAKMLRKKGWGTAKIERRRNDRQADFERRVAEAEARKNRPPHNAQIWCDFVRAVIAARAARSIGLLLHFYHTRIDGERIPIAGRRVVLESELTPECLLEMEEDVLYEIVGAGCSG